MPAIRRLLISTVLLILSAACGGSDDDAQGVPKVVGKPLDEALAEMRLAGYVDEELSEGDVDPAQDNIEVLGGGTFGVLDPGNWVICDQKPAAGEPAPNGVILKVDREYDCELTASKQLTVPHVVGSRLDEAEAAFETAGFQFIPDAKDATRCRRLVIDYANWRVVRQRPPAGAAALADARSTLFVEKIGEPC
jgi:beta-lactam-binding protein with PASTA domain